MKTGYLKIIMGPMMSGKSVELRKEITRYVDVGLRVCYINSVLDVRDTASKDQHTTTHSSEFSKLSPKIKPFSTQNLSDLELQIFDYDIIGIDEGNFYPDITCVVDWVEKYDKHIIISGLNGTYKRVHFGKLHELIPHADIIIKLNAECINCAKTGNLVPAPFTYYMGNHDINKELIIGGAEKYKPLCRACYYNETKKVQNNKILKPSKEEDDELVKVQGLAKQSKEEVDELDNTPKVTKLPEGIDLNKFPPSILNGQNKNENNGTVNIYCYGCQNIEFAIIGIFSYAIPNSKFANKVSMTHNILKIPIKKVKRIELSDNIDDQLINYAIEFEAEYPGPKLKSTIYGVSTLSEDLSKVLESRNIQYKQLSMTDVARNNLFRELVIATNEILKNGRNDDKAILYES